jgi:putative membrane protein
VASDRVPAACLAVFVTVWTALAIAPRYPETWLLENLLIFVAIPALVLTYRSFRFSDRAYVQATLFLVLHTIGSHYTYSEVPFGVWLAGAVGGPRNHYDRIVHFSFGLLILRSQWEIWLRGAHFGRGRSAFLACAVTGFWGMLYELLEWLVAVIVNPAARFAYLGVQGDPWDAQKDMALVGIGAFIATAFECWLGARRAAGEELMQPTRAARALSSHEARRPWERRGRAATRPRLPDAR